MKKLQKSKIEGNIIIFWFLYITRKFVKWLDFVYMLYFKRAGFPIKTNHEKYSTADKNLHKIKGSFNKNIMILMI